MRSVFIGWEPREADAYRVALASLNVWSSEPQMAVPIVLGELQAQGLYYRPIRREDGRLHDVLSIQPDYNGQMSTEFAISRFFVPHLCRKGWALFIDCDMLFRDDVQSLFEYCEKELADKALACVQHKYEPAPGLKMDGCLQTQYARKNWSSVMAFNCEHPAHKALTIEVLNTLPGRDFHRFCWLNDDEIGALPLEWNWLVGHSPTCIDPSLVHFTTGIPSMPGHENDPFADEWRSYL